MTFIDKHRDCLSVDFVCTTLNREREGGFISSRGYRNAKSRQLSVRAKRDERLVEIVAQIHASNYSVYGVRKMWHALFVGVQRYVTGNACWSSALVVQVMPGEYDTSD